jgi:hypothetical protein
VVLDLYGRHSVVLSANKLHLFSPTQHRFIVIQSVTLHVRYMFRPVLGFCTDMPEYDLSTGPNM